jgi:predicted transcriptional regulator of viral defense system
MDAGELYEIARCNGGLVTRAQARAVGVSDQRLHELVRHGVVARVAHGVYAMGTTPHCRADPLVVTTACNVGLSHESAAAWYGVDLPEPPDHTHVTAPRNRGRRRDAISGVRLHRKTLGGYEVTELRGVRVTTPLRTALDIARHASLEHGVAIVDSFLRAGMLSADEFIAAAGRCHGPGRVRIQLVASLIDSKSGSILESLTRVLLWRNQIPPPTSQYSFTHPTRGWIGYMDFAWPQVRAILECDGYEYHASRIPFQKDRRRWSAIGGAGWHLGVVTWFDVTCDPQYVIDLARELLSLELLHTTVA